MERRRTGKGIISYRRRDRKFLVTRAWLKDGTPLQDTQEGEMWREFKGSAVIWRWGGQRQPLKREPLRIRHRTTRQGLLAFDRGRERASFKTDSSSLWKSTPIEPFSFSVFQNTVHAIIAHVNRLSCRRTRYRLEDSLLNLLSLRNKFRFNEKSNRTIHLYRYPKFRWTRFGGKEVGNVEWKWEEKRRSSLKERKLA